MDGEHGRSESNSSRSLAETFTASPLDLDETAFAQTLVANVSEGLITVDETGTIVFVNPAVEDLVGYPPGDLVGASLLRLIPERLADVHREAFERYVETGERQTDWDGVELHARHADGHDVPVTISFREHTHEGRRLFTGVLRDRSGRLKRERALEEREQQFRSLVDAVEEYAIYRLDRDGHVETWNQGAATVTGYEEHEVRGRHLSVFYSESAVEAGIPDEELSMAASEGTIEVEGWRVHKDGTRYWARVTVTAIRDDAGELTGFAVVTQDVTRQRQEENRQHLLTKISRGFAEAKTIDDGLRTALTTLCTVTSLDYGQAWVPTESEPALECVVTASGGERVDTSEAQWSADDRTRLEDLAERVWTSGEPEWSTLHGPLNDPSTSSSATEESNRGDDWTALGVPIDADGAVVAVLTFALAESHASDDQLYELVKAAVRPLGTMVVRKQVEADLERERAFLDKLLETSPVGIVVAEPDGTITRVNDYVERLFGLTTGEAVGRQYFELGRRIYDDTGTRLTVDEFPITRVFEENEPVFDYEFGIDRFDGEERWLSASSAPVRTADGDVEQVVAAVRDVTERKAHEQELRRRLTQQQVVTELGQIALETTDLDGLFERAVVEVRETLDTDACTVFEHDPERDELCVRADIGWIDRVDVDSDPTLGADTDSQVGHTLRTGEPLVVDDVETETRMETTVPTAPDVASGITVRIGTDGHTWGVLGAYTTDPHSFSEHDRNFVQTVATLLTSAIEREAADRKVRAFREAVEQAGHAIYLTDVDGTIEYVNPAFERLTGYEAEEAIGENPRLFQSGVHSESFYANLWDTILGGEVWHGEVTNERKSGERFIINQTIAPVTDDNGEIERFVAVNADITAQKERGRMLERQRRSLERIRQVTESLRPLNRALARASTRDEIEQTVCEQLATSDAYQFAWYGSYNPAVKRVTPSAWSGASLTDIDDLDVERWEALSEAVETGNVCTVPDLAAEHEPHPWPATGPESDSEAAAVVPVVFDDMVHGVVGVYSARANAFDEYERALLGELGERVGHALNAARNKQLLHTDTAVELEFRTRAPEAVSAAITEELGCRLTLKTMVPTTGNKFVGYLDVDGASPEVIRDRLADSPVVQSVRVVDKQWTSGTIEYVVDKSPTTTLINYGATIRSAMAEDGVETIRAEVAPESNIQEITDGMEGAYSDTAFVAKRTIDRPVRELVATRQAVGETLTDRQREVLELAYHAGFFKSPRETTGEELADSLGISSATFYVHVRNALQKLLQQLLEGETHH